MNKPIPLEQYRTRFDGYWIVERVLFDHLDPARYQVDLVRRQFFRTPQADPLTLDADEFQTWCLKTGATIVVPAPRRFVGERLA